MKISQGSTLVMGRPWRNPLFVKVEADDGLVGWGEARPVGGGDGHRALRPNCHLQPLASPRT